jgi:coproporphyrinogen III oxidase-like Fe-S oxidoreductase
VASELGEGLARTPRVDVEMLAQAEAAREDAMLGMRLVAGITDDLAARGGAGDALLSLEADGLVVHEGSRWRVTARGWLLGNEVFARIWNADAV